MVKIGDGRYVIGFDDGYQLGKTANYIFDNGVHMLGSVEPTLKENSLFYEGEYFKVGEGRAAITEDKVSSDAAMLRTMAAIAMELGSAGIRRAEVVLAVGLLLVVPLQGVLQNPTISTATSYILPALFGCMALGILGRGAGPTYVKNKLLIIVVPAVLVSILAIMGIASSGMAGFLLLVMIPLSILCAWILWKKGIVKVLPNK